MTAHLLSESARSRIYLIQDPRWSQPVIKKIYNGDSQDDFSFTDFVNEFEILKEINVESVRKSLEYQESDEERFILLEYFEGFKIKDIIQPGGDNLLSTLDYFAKICRVLHQVHKAGVIHKNLSPDHILVNPQSHEISLLDFSIATKIESLEPFAIPNAYKSNLHYISPEHSGRMNRKLDSRSDIYSLGVIFYELLTGVLPFQADDPIDLLHFHVAMTPPSLRKLRKDIPEALEAVVIKALSKEADDRYQSMLGMAEDFVQIQSLLKSKSSKVFTPGEKDVPITFRIPQKLYGRDNELNELKKHFRWSGKDTNKLVLVDGYSGVGKTSLVMEVHKKVGKAKGYFLKGKYDLLQYNIPYSGIRSSLNEFVDFLLAEDESLIKEVSKKIQDAIGNDSYLLTQIVPSMELLIGKQEPSDLFHGIERQNKINHLFTRLLMAIARKNSPITFFLDDLQWIDSASLNLIQNLSSNKNIENLLIIGAYRSNEVGPEHILSKAIRNLESDGINVKRINLDNLSEEDVSNLISDSLSRKKNELEDLSRIIYEKTLGNAFYVNQVLKEIFNLGHLYFDDEKMLWQWNLEAIEKLGLTDNVIDLLIKKLKTLDPNTQELVTTAAFIGNKFPLEYLQTISKNALPEIRKLIRPAEEEGLVQVKNNIVEFGHDKIQQAAYELAGKERAVELHLEIGRYLLAKLENQSANVEGELQIFEVVNQLNEGEELVENIEERRKYSRLNLEAGLEAKNSAAYAGAMDYFSKALKFLGKEDWEKDYEFLMAVHTSLVECAYLGGHPEVVDAKLEFALSQSKDVLDQIPLHRIKIEKLKSENNLTQALEEGLKILELLSVKLPRNPSKFDVLRRFIYLRWIMAGKKVESLESLPEMSDPLRMATIQLLVTIGPAVYWSSPNLTAMVILEMVILSLKYGNTNESAFAYSTYGLLLCGFTGEIELGHKFGKLARQLAYKYGGVSEAKGIFNINCFVNHWKEKVSNSLPDFNHSYHVGMIAGDLEFAALSAYLYCNHGFHAGLDLNNLVKDMETNSAQISHIKQNTPLNYLLLHYQAALNFMGGSSDPTMLVGSVYNEETMLPQHIKAQDKTALFKYNLLKMILYYHFRKSENIEEFIEEGKKYGEAVLGMLVSAVFEFYSGLIYARLGRNWGGLKRRKAIKILRNATRRFRKWAEHSPDNHLHKYLILQAEWDRINGDTQKALLHYEKAIQIAEKNGYHQELGLAYELNGEFHIERKMEKLAGYYFEKARDVYSEWGARAKVSQLTSKYPQIFSEGVGKSTNKILQETDLDLQSILRASEAVSREIKLEKLTRKLLRIVVQSVLAENGYLIIVQGDGWKVQDYWSVDFDMENNPPSLSEIPEVPSSIINSVEKSREGIMIADAAANDRFKEDSVVRKRKVVSVIAVPLISRNELVGIIYLENNKMQGAFSESRFSLLEMLSGQIAVSLGNALLFGKLESAVEEQRSLKNAYSKFLPALFLDALEKESILDVGLNDQVSGNMTLMFCGIKDYGEISDSMTAEENFRFLNGYFMRINPIIHKQGGFILRFMGDGFLAVFPEAPQNAFDAGISILQEIRTYNSTRVWEKGRRPVSVGIGLHYGEIIMGVMGDEKRMAQNVVSDVVNIASRIQQLTHIYGANLILSSDVLDQVDSEARDLVRSLGKVIVKEGDAGIFIFDCIKGSGDREGRIKKKTLSEFETAVNAYFKENFADAAIGFKAVVEKNPEDAAASYYLKKAAEYMANTPKDWSRAEEFIK